MTKLSIVTSKNQVNFSYLIENQTLKNIEKKERMREKETRRRN